MPTANGKNSITRTGGRVGGDSATHSRQASAAGGIAKTGPVRGYIKLSDAVKAFGFDFRGKTVLDIGSSTGGFTQYAIDHGATKVIAVEKGTNQMISPLRHDHRIELHEKTDIFSFQTKDKIDVIVADVSFISLTEVLLYAKTHLATNHTTYLVMLKPQFEAKPADLHRGVVKNERLRRNIIKDFELWLKCHDFVIIKKQDNRLSGKTGNKERFYLLSQAMHNTAN